MSCFINAPEFRDLTAFGAGLLTPPNADAANQRSRGLAAQGDLRSSGCGSVGDRPQQSECRVIPREPNALASGWPATRPAAGAVASVANRVAVTPREPNALASGWPATRPAAGAVGPAANRVAVTSREPNALASGWPASTVGAVATHGHLGQNAKTGPLAASLPEPNEKLEKPCRSYRKKRRGAAAVEFAVVAPLFFLLTFGMIEYGRMVMVQQVITNASREGARKAILSGATEEDVVSLVVEYLQKGAINVDSSAVSVDDLDQAESGDPITVTVSIPFNQVSWLPSPMFLGATTLSASTVMRRESIE